MLDENEENWIAAQEQKLRQTRFAQNRLLKESEDIRRLSKEVTPEQERITREIEALEKIAVQTESEIFDFLAKVRKRLKPDF